MNKKHYQLIFYAFVFAAIFFLDRLTKAVVLYNQEMHGYQIGSFLRFDVSFNRGISWGLFDSQNSWTFVALSLLIVAITIGFAIEAFFRWKRDEIIIGEIMVIAGSCSNIIDRIFYGGVLDFIFFSLGQWSWPVFNIADLCIVVGIFLIVLFHWVGSKKQ